MEIQEENANGINPKNMIGTERFQIRYSEEHDDVILTEERNAKNGGTFKQFTLLLAEEDGSERELRFLFNKHLNTLIRAFGGDTKKWQGKDILVIPQTKGEYADVKLEPAGRRLKEHITEVIEEQVV